MDVEIVTRGNKRNGILNKLQHSDTLQHYNE